MLNPLIPQKVQFCIPTHIRDEQIKIAVKRISKRLQPGDKLIDEPIAIVCFGPSLKKEWEKIKNFKYIMTCSGAHKFLVDKGIVPNFHVEVDPRAHKIELIGKPNKETKYYIASACHPKVFDLLEGYDVTLWHVFETKEESMRILPRGDWAITGGSSVGLRTMLMARFLGFTNLHIFGMDGSFENENTHASYHPNNVKHVAEQCEYNNKIFYTTKGIMECARQTFNELDQMPDVSATFYGEGLVQEMAKDYKKKEFKKETIIGFRKPLLYTPEYLELIKQLFNNYPDFGMGGSKHSDMVLKIFNAINGKSILDYGCGRGFLAKSLDFPIWEYDPAIPGKDESPKPADLVVCTDVLEHIEPEKLLVVLDDIKRCILHTGYLVISTRHAGKILSDGRNAHLIIQNSVWWLELLKNFFVINDSWFEEKNQEFHVIVMPRTDIISQIEIKQNG